MCTACFLKFLHSYANSKTNIIRGGLCLTTHMVAHSDHYPETAAYHGTVLV